MFKNSVRLLRFQTHFPWKNKEFIINAQDFPQFPRITIYFKLKKISNVYCRRTLSLPFRSSIACLACFAMQVCFRWKSALDQVRSASSICLLSRVFTRLSTFDFLSRWENDGQNSVQRMPQRPRHWAEVSPLPARRRSCYALWAQGTKPPGS